MAKRNKLSVGDVLSVDVGTGVAYLQYIGSDDTYGDAIAVAPRIYQLPLADVPMDVFDRSYVTFYPANVAVAKGLVRVVGHLPPKPFPTRFRRQGAISGRRVLTWIIDDGSSSFVKHSLSDEELELPIASGWTHPLLVRRIIEGWHPTNVGRSDDGVAAREALSLAEGPPPATLQRISHYLYFPEERTAASIARKLREENFDTEVRLAADGANWLVVARQQVVASDTGFTSRDLLEKLAADAGGEYDGWEAEVAPRKA